VSLCVSLTDQLDPTELDIVLDKIEAIGNTIHTYAGSPAAGTKSKYYFWVFTQGRGQFCVFYDTRELATIRRAELMRILGEFKAGKYTASLG